jgi:hypothetical protein
MPPCLVSRPGADQHFLHRGVAPEVLNGVGGSKAFVLAFAIAAP